MCVCSILPKTTYSWAMFVCACVCLIVEGKTRQEFVPTTTTYYYFNDNNSFNNNNDNNNNNNNYYYYYY